MQVDIVDTGDAVDDVNAVVTVHAVDTVEGVLGIVAVGAVLFYSPIRPLPVAPPTRVAELGGGAQSYGGTDRVAAVVALRRGLHGPCIPRPQTFGVDIRLGSNATLTPGMGTPRDQPECLKRCSSRFA
jgi:hypothetical protein